MTAGLEELDFAPENDVAPGSVRPVVPINGDGQCQIELIHWGFKLPDRLLFNARSEGIELSKFWRDAFLKGRIIVPADAIFEWKELPKGQKKPKYEITLRRPGTLDMAGALSPIAHSWAHLIKFALRGQPVRHLWKHAVPPPSSRLRFYSARRALIESTLNMCSNGK